MSTLQAIKTGLDEAGTDYTTVHKGSVEAIKGRGAYGPVFVYIDDSDRIIMDTPLSAHVYDSVDEVVTALGYY